MVPFTSLDAATATGPGESRDLGELCDHHTMVFFATGGPSCTIVLEGSHDDVNWFSMASQSPSAGFTGPTALTVPLTAVPGVLVRYVRANLTALSGGTTPTVTATIASDASEED